jgi:FkbM family methyltransferase
VAPPANLSIGSGHEPSQVVAIGQSFAQEQQNFPFVRNLAVQGKINPSSPSESTIGRNGRSPRNSEQRAHPHAVPLPLIAVAPSLLSRSDVIPEFIVRRLAGSRFARRANFTMRGTINGTVVRVPVWGGLGTATPPVWAQEPWLNRIVAKLLDACDGAFLDVGVNLGQSLLKVKTLRPSVRYVGFEPNPVCVAYARRLAMINGFRDVTIAPFGLSDRAAAVPLFARDDDPADSSATVVPGLYQGQGDWGRTPAALLPGDETLASLAIGRIGVIKVDVEGAELEVLRGLSHTLDRDRPAIVCEILPTYSGSKSDSRRAFRQPRIDALLDIMRGFDYQLFRLMPDGRIVPLKTIEPHSDKTLTNYAFVQPAVVPALVSDVPPDPPAHGDLARPGPG